MALDREHKLVCSHVARILREERTSRGLSMLVLANKAGLTQPMISYMERELRTPNLDTLLRLTAALEVPLENVIRRARRAAAKQSPE